MPELPLLQSSRVVNMHEAKTHLSSLVDAAVLGEPFIIAKSGKPQVIVYAYANNGSAVNRLGCMPELDLKEDFALGLDSFADPNLAELFLSGELEPKTAPKSGSKQHQGGQL